MALLLVVLCMRLNLLLYMAFLLALILVASGCGEEWEQRILKPFARSSNTDTGGDSKGMTTFTGTMEVLSMEELRKIAASDFTGKVLKNPRIEMGLKIDKSGLISEGRISIRIQDKELTESQPYSVYRAGCSSGKDRQCGSFKNEKLDVNLYDDSGFMTLKSTQSSGGQIFGFVTLDGRNENSKLGDFSLTGEGSKGLDKEKTKNEK